jgi:hypothetical protein
MLIKFKVLWIGGISLLIALLSLGVSLMQAVAAFQALNSNPFGNGTLVLKTNGTVILQANGTNVAKPHGTLTVS